MSDIAVAESGTRLQNFLDRAGLRGFPWKTATVLYTISWGWLFIVRDSLWSDDWDEFKFRDLTDFDYGAFGFAPWKNLNILMFDNFGPAFLRVAVFSLFFLSCLFVYKILDRVSFIDSWQRPAISLLFLLLPFNTPRVALYTFYFSLSYCLFFAAWYLLVAFHSRRSKFLACVLFFLSFQMFTMLVFFVLPVLSHFILNGRVNIGGAKKWLHENLFLILLPIAYWILRSLFWPSSRSYHELTENKVSSFLRFMTLFLLMIVGLLTLYRRLESSYKKAVLLLLVGLFSMFVGYVPYLIYGLAGYGFGVPSNYLITMFGRSDWFSRHQILQPLGLSILLIGLISLLPSIAGKVKSWTVGAILSISVVFNIAFGFEYVVDHSKQTSIVAALAAKPNSTAGDEIQMVDQTAFLNARQRSYRERDWLGLIGLADGVNPNKGLKVSGDCSKNPNTRLVLIQGPRTHWQALKNWVSDRDMGFKVTVDDTPGACKPEMVTNQRSSGAIPILFYFTGAKG
jgi:hypothetical protein